MSGGKTNANGPLSGRLIVLGITGSIAAFKAPEIVRALRAAGADVQALLTPAATKFVSPLTLRTLTGHAVDADLLDLLPDGRIGHIVAADSADAILVAPATAQWLGAMAGGLAGDAVTAACLTINPTKDSQPRGVKPGPRPGHRKGGMPKGYKFPKK